MERGFAGEMQSCMLPSPIAFQRQLDAARKGAVSRPTLTHRTVGVRAELRLLGSRTHRWAHRAAANCQRPSVSAALLPNCQRRQLPADRAKCCLRRTSAQPNARSARSPTSYPPT